MWARNFSRSAASAVPRICTARSAAFARLAGGRLPGGAAYCGVGSVTCITGTTPSDGDVFVLNILGGDEDPAPEMAFDAPPSAVERLGGDGAWRAVSVARTDDGTYKLDTLVQPQRVAVFRIRR